MMHASRVLKCAIQSAEAKKRKNQQAKAKMMGEATSPRATTAAAQKDSLSSVSPLEAANAVSVAFSVCVLARHLTNNSGGADDDNDVGVYLLGSAAQVGAWDVDKAGNI